MRYKSTSSRSLSFLQYITASTFITPPPTTMAPSLLLLVAKRTSQVARHAFPTSFTRSGTRRHCRSPLPHAKRSGHTPYRVKTTSWCATAASHPFSIPRKRSRKPKKPRKRKVRNVTYVGPLTAPEVFGTTSLISGSAQPASKRRALAPFNAASAVSRILLIPGMLEMGCGCAKTAEAQLRRKSCRRHQSLRVLKLVSVMNLAPPIEVFDDERISICPGCHMRLTPFPVIPSMPESRLNERDFHASFASQGVPISEYNSDHLYSDDSSETRATTPPPQRLIGLGITFQDSEEEEEEGFRPTPPLKDRKYYQESPTLPTPPLKDSKYYRDSSTLPAMDYTQSYLHQPGTKHPYAPSPVPTTMRKASVTFAQYLPTPETASNASRKQRHEPNQSFNPTTYPYPSPPSTPAPLHTPRPASSVYPTDEAATDFPYPPPPIPQRFANRPKRSSSVTPGTLSKAALARTEPASPRSRSSPVKTEGERMMLNRRSSWYDFWKPVFEKTGEKSF